MTPVTTTEFCNNFQQWRLGSQQRDVMSIRWAFIRTFGMHNLNSFLLSSPGALIRSGDIIKRINDL